MKVRLLQVVIALTFGAVALLGGELVAQATSANGPSSSSTSSTGSNAPITLPEQVKVMGPNDQVAGTVPRSDLIGQPPASTPGQPPPVASTPGAYVVVNGEAGYPVSNDGALVGYWVPPTGFMSVAQVESAGAVPADGAPQVGSQ